MLNKLHIRALIPAATLSMLLCLAAACGQDEPEDMTSTTTFPTIASQLTDTGETPSHPSTPAFETSTPQLEAESSPSTTPTPQPTLVPLQYFIETATPTATPSTTGNTTLTPQPQANALDAPSVTPETDTVQRHVFPTPDLPEGIGAPPVPPAFPANQTPRPTRTPSPTVPITIELDEDDPINSASWYQDGLTQTELKAIHLLRAIADTNNITVESWLDMPRFQVFH